MKKADFTFCIGYQGNTAIVDKNAVTKYGKLTTAQLIEKSLFKPAFCLALYNQSEIEMTEVLEAYNKQSGAGYKDISSLQRLFGVYKVPENIEKIIKS